MSRKTSGKEKQVLEGVELDANTIARCFRDNPQDGEEAVQAGLVEWIGGHHGKQPPTWRVLLEALQYAEIPVQDIQDLKKSLGLDLRQQS